MQEEFEKVKQELAPFRVKKGDDEWQYWMDNLKIDAEGKITNKTRLKWLEFRKVIKIYNIEHESYGICIDKGTADKPSCKMYEQTEDLLERFKIWEFKQNLGKMGVKKKVEKDDILAAVEASDF